MRSAHSTPQIFVTGRITKATNFDCESLFIKWSLNFGTNFKLIEGGLKGETFQGEGRYGECTINFDHPINFNLSCRSIKGWPKILVEAWSTDIHGRNSLIGYGTSFLPFKKGSSLIKIKCWRPSQNLTSSISERLLGNNPEFIDKSAVFSTEDKFGLHSISTGNVIIELDMIEKDFDLHGIAMA
jgi:hypothetical protein